MLPFIPTILLTPSPIYISSSQDCCILEPEILWGMGKNTEEGLVQEIFFISDWSQSRSWPCANTLQHPQLPLVLPLQATTAAFKGKCPEAEHFKHVTLHFPILHLLTSLSPICIPSPKLIFQKLCLLCSSFPFQSSFVLLSSSPAKWQPKECPSQQNGGHSNRIQANEKDRRK